MIFLLQFLIAEPSFREAVFRDPRELFAPFLFWLLEPTLKQVLGYTIGSI